MRRFHVLWLCLAAFASLGAQQRTPNFVVTAPTPQVAQQVAQWAEHFRREKAQLWLGQEMPTWSQPCPLTVNLTMDGPSGATSFHFGQNRVLGMKMEIQGPLDRLLASVLPHEITHTVFAHYFRAPVPRWADEGGSVLSEDDLERERHDKLTRQILNHGQQIPLRRLFSLKEYPREVMCLYAQGFSMSDYLVKRSDRRTFLAFVHQGSQVGWDNAVQTFYGHRSVEELEEAWLKHLRDTKRQPTEQAPVDMQLAQNQPRFSDNGQQRTVVRLTVPPVQPLDPAPIVRGAAPTPDQVGLFFGDRQPTLMINSPYTTTGPPVPGSGWQPVNPGPQTYPGPVQLGQPQYGPMTSYPTSSVGFPR